jgi:L-seryl-tRNA(Ser) seleniumtransferase
LNQINKQEALRAIPPINKILESEILADRLSRDGRESLLRIAKRVLEAYKKNVTEDSDFCANHGIKSEDEVLDFLLVKILAAMDEEARRGLSPVINATGIVLHTNLGRASLPKSAIEAVSSVSRGYSNLEYDLETGRRGSRHTYAETLIKRLTGAESALIVNNNAAAIFLCLNTFARDREVIVSRGQQVEIGGSFRIPDLIASSGAKMVEIGTTNKTHLKDYEKAITLDTRVLLKVHTSNYKVTGFAESVALDQLVSLGKKKDLLVVEDLGSGSLIDLTTIGLPYEPTVQDSIRGGADLVTFSGDKLLGGPQAGIIAGKKVLIDQIRENPLMRMVRPCKMTFAALTAVLKIYDNEAFAAEHIPVLEMMALKTEALQAKAETLLESIEAAVGIRLALHIAEEQDEVGGGSLPSVLLPGKAVALAPDGISVSELQEKLRKYRMPILGYIKKDSLLLNVRTLAKEDYAVIASALKEILGEAR